MTIDTMAPPPRALSRANQALVVAARQGTPCRKRGARGKFQNFRSFRVGR